MPKFLSRLLTAIAAAWWGQSLDSLNMAVLALDARESPLAMLTRIRIRCLERARMSAEMFNADDYLDWRRAETSVWLIIVKTEYWLHLWNERVEYESRRTNDN